MNYKQRREKLYKLLVGREFLFKSGNTDFVYLTGIDRKDVALGFKNGAETLYIPQVDPMKERWNGKMLRPEGLDFDNVIEGEVPEGSSEIPEITQLRAVKSEEELDAISDAIFLTAEGITKIMSTARPGMYEYNVRAEFEKVLADKGCHVPAFPTIVGAGENSLCLHYDECSRELNEGDIVLLDLGAVKDHLCADISRVFPVGGKFTPKQKALTELACDCVDFVCDNIKPGEDNKRLNELQDEYLRPRLEKLGLPGEVKDYRWHNISHHLGYDVHDTPPRETPLVPGSVFTLEVGLYVDDWGFGVRIEDDAVMRENKCENLSSYIPRRPEEIEEYMQKNNPVC